MTTGGGVACLGRFALGVGGGGVAWEEEELCKSRFLYVMSVPGMQPDFAFLITQFEAAIV